MPASKILVVERSPEVRSQLVDGVLRPAGFLAFKAANGEAGLEIARSAQPDLVIAGLTLPGISGLELAQRLQQLGQNIPVLLALEAESEAPQPQAAGVAGYLVKPLQPDDLLAAVRRVLEAARARRDQDGRQAEHESGGEGLNERLQELETLISLGHDLTSMLDANRVLERVVEAAVELTGAEEGLLLLLDESTQELSMRAAKNFEENFVRTFRLRSDDSLAGQVIRTGQPVLLTKETPQKIKTLYLVHSLVYVPLIVRGRVIGVLGVDNRQAGRSFTLHDQRLLQVLGGYAAIAIDNARLYARSETERSQLEAILKETDDAVIVVDTAERVILVNPAARSALSIPPGDLAGRPADEVVRAGELQDLLRSERRWGEVKLEDGRVLNAHLTPIVGLGRAVVMQDITPLKELDRVKSEFVTAVSHDLRSPLTAILGYVELISRTGPVNDQQQDFIRRIQISVQSITSLITDLLDLGRIEAGFDSRKEPTHLGLVVRYAVEGQRPQAEARRQRLEVTLPDDLPRVLADPPRLRQMLGNLIDNAIKYTPDDGAVQVTARAEDDLVILTVSDNGLGIPPAEQPFIFDKFFRASNVRHNGLGTGLGLSIVKSIVESHGGRVWLESTIDQGTTFTVMLPVYRDPERRPV